MRKEASLCEILIFLHKTLKEQQIAAGGNYLTEKKTGYVTVDAKERQQEKHEEETDEQGGNIDEENADRFIQSV